MRNICIPLMTLCLVTALAACLPAPLAADNLSDNLTLRFTSAYMDRHPAYLEAFIPWMREVEAASGGSLKIQYFNPNTLAPEAAMYDAVSAGLADIAANAHGRTPGRFPLMGVFDLPLLFPDTLTGSLVSQELFSARQDLQAEMTQAKPLWHYVSAPHVLNTKTPILNLEDLRGLKIIAWAPLAVEVLKALGANPIQAVPHDSYLAVQRKMADGVLCPLSPLRSFKISEAVSHTTTVPLMVDSFWVAMSHATWAKLNAAQQAALESTLADMPRRTGLALQEGVTAEMDILAAQGHQFHNLSAAELTRWQTALTPIYDAWLKDMAGRGLPQAPDLLATVRRMAGQASTGSPANDWEQSLPPAKDIYAHPAP